MLVQGNSAPPRPPSAAKTEVAMHPLPLGVPPKSPVMGTVPPVTAVLPSPSHPAAMAAAAAAAQVCLVSSHEAVLPNFLQV